MRGKLAFAGALALGCVPREANAEALYTHPHVKQVICTFANGMQGRGTAWRVSKGRFASVSHVTGRGGACTLDGKLIAVEYDDPFGDFSIIRVEDDVEGGIPVNCSGYYHGYNYYSVGFARGAPWSVVITLRSNKLLDPFLYRPGWSLFSGIEHVIPGMSGGPILDRYGRAVGAVNAYNKQKGLSWSRPLQETPLCS